MITKTPRNRSDHKDYRISEQELVKARLKAHFDPAADHGLLGVLSATPKGEHHAIW